MKGLNIMNILIKSITKKLLPALIVTASFGAITQAGTLENLERERSVLIQTIIDADLTNQERFNKIDASSTRLIDLERMVLRDDSLKGKSTPVIRKAFANYDLTFLVHASAEHNSNIISHWLKHIGVTTQTILNSKKAKRAVTSSSQNGYY